MSLDRALQRLATQIDSGRDAKLRMRLGTVDSYTPGSAEVSVVVGGDTVDAPFISGYTPTEGDRVIVLFNAGSPIVIGASGTAPVSDGGNAIEAQGYFLDDSNTYPLDGSNIVFDVASPGTTAGFFEIVVDGGSTWISLLQDGMYFCQFGCRVSTSGPGDLFRLTVDRGGSINSGYAESTTDAAGDTYLSAATAVDFESGGLIGVRIERLSGSGTGLSLNNHALIVTKFAGGFPA